MRETPTSTANWEITIRPPHTGFIQDVQQILPEVKSFKCIAHALQDDGSLEILQTEAPNSGCQGLSGSNGLRLLLAYC